MYTCINVCVCDALLIETFRKQSGLGLQLTNLFRKCIWGGAGNALSRSEFKYFCFQGASFQMFGQNQLQKVYRSCFVLPRDYYFSFILEGKGGFGKICNFLVNISVGVILAAMKGIPCPPV